MDQVALGVYRIPIIIRYLLVNLAYRHAEGEFSTDTSYNNLSNRRRYFEDDLR